MIEQQFDFTVTFKTLHSFYCLTSMRVMRVIDLTNRAKKIVLCIKICFYHKNQTLFILNPDYTYIRNDVKIFFDHTLRLNFKCYSRYKIFLLYPHQKNGGSRIFQLSRRDRSGVLKQKITHLKIYSCNLIFLFFMFCFSDWKVEIEKAGQLFIFGWIWSKISIDCAKKKKKIVCWLHHKNL